MATALVSFEVNPSGFFKRDMPAMQRRLEDFSPMGPFVHSIMRQGPGSVGEQFATEAEHSMAGKGPWPKTQPFGNRPAPLKTLQRTGALLSAWSGTGPGAISSFTRDTFTIAVDTNLYPQAGVFQSQVPTVVRAKKRGKNGRLAMQMFLGMTYGVWISARKLLAGLVIPPRRVSPNRVMTSRAGESLARFVLGLGPTRAEGDTTFPRVAA